MPGVWALGPSTVTVQVVAEGIGGQVAEPVTGATTVWSMPWIWLAVAVLLIGAAVYVGWRRGTARALADLAADNDEQPSTSDRTDN